MTKEAINELKKYTSGRKNTEKIEVSVLALNRIIFALEQEPCTDAISRQYLLDNCVVDKVTMPYVPVNKIESAPPITPQHNDAEIQKIQEMEQAEIQKAYELGKAEMQTSEDVISRQAVLEQIDQWAIGNREYLPTNAIHYLTRRIQDLPSVSPQLKTDVLDKIRTEIEEQK